MTGMSNCPMDHDGSSIFLDQVHFCLPLYPSQKNWRKKNLEVIDICLYLCICHLGVMTVLLLMAFRFCNIFQNAGEDRTEFQAGEASPVQTPLLLPKDDDALSWGSSYECISNDEEDLEEFLAVSSLESKSINEGNDNYTQRLCVICFDGPRDCFFLPCGHCATCFTCGTRYKNSTSCLLFFYAQIEILDIMTRFSRCINPFIC